MALTAACSSEGGDSTTAAGPTGGDGGPVFDAVHVTPLSTAEHDRLLGAAFDADNRLYGAGWVADGADQMMAVARFGLDGRLDPAFGTAGVATSTWPKAARRWRWPGA